MTKKIIITLCISLLLPNFAGALTMKEILQGYDDPKPGQVLGLSDLAAPVITPNNAAVFGHTNTMGAVVVSQGQTLKFSANMPVAWSLGPGSVGTIDADGNYQAPAKVTPKQIVGGCQMLPNNHIFNTRIDSLPARTDQAALNWLESTRVEKQEVNHASGWPLNIVRNSTPTVTHHFNYFSPQADGSGWWWPPAPVRRFQSGEFAEGDQHLFAINRDSCVVQETYQASKEMDLSNSPSALCPTCTAASGTRFDSLAPGLPTSAVDASGVNPMMSNTLSVEELEKAVRTGGSINHMVRVTMHNSHLLRAFVWPAMSNAWVGTSGNVMPYGTVVRLKSSYTALDNSTNPYTRVLIKQLKEYGMILSDGSAGGDADWNIPLDYGGLHPQIHCNAGGTCPATGALSEIKSANIFADQLEVVDISGLKLASDLGIVNPNNSYGVTPTDHVEVIATNLNGGAQSRVYVSLRGVTVGMNPGRNIWVQAGNYPTQIEAWVHGTSNTALTWTLSPAIDGVSISNTGVLVPNANITTPTITRLKVASVADSSAYAERLLVLWPAGPIRISANGVNYASSTWDGGTRYTANVLYEGKNEDVSGYDYGGNWGHGTSPAPYGIGRTAYEPYLEWNVPNGQYQLTVMIGSCATCGSHDFQVNDQMLVKNLSLATDQEVVMNFTVSNNKIILRSYRHNDATPSISAFKLVSSSGGVPPVSPTPTPTPIPTVTPTPVPTVDTVAPVISSIVSSGITSSTATITWLTNEPSDSQIEYGLSSAYGTASPIDSTKTLSHTVNFSSLTPGTTYYYRVKSRDLAGNLSISSGQSFTTTGASVTPTPTPTPTPTVTPTPTPTQTNPPAGGTGGWYSSSWLNKKTLTINKAQVQGTLTNFPVLVSVTDPELKSTSNAGKVASTLGYDLVFTTSSNTKLSHEIEKYDPATGQLIAWVKVPSLTSANDTSLNLYFGNTTATDQQDKTNVWDNNYKGVWHLGTDPTTSVSDSSANSKTLTNGSALTSADSLSAKIGNGVNYDAGVGDYLYRADDSDLEGLSTLTISTWFKLDDTSSTRILANKGEVVYKFRTNGAKLQAYFSGGTTVTHDTTLSTNTWYYGTVTYNGTTLAVYLNGGTPKTGSLSGTLNTNTNQFRLGQQYDAASPLNGIMDEARFSNIARSSDWIKTEYNNQSSPSSFVIVSAASAYTPPLAPTPTPTPTPVQTTPTPTPTPTTPTTPIVTFQNTPAPNTPTPTPTPVTTQQPTTTNYVPLKLINLNGTYYVVKDGQRLGITNPGMLFSYGLEFKDASLPTTAEALLPEGPILSPGDGALVKSPLDPTVYLISLGKKHGFNSEATFRGLGFSFTKVLTVTAPELDKMPLGEVLSDPNLPHKPGTDINIQGTIYYIGSDSKRYGYPTETIWNSWHFDNDFSNVVIANTADLSLQVGDVVSLRKIE